jgi:hypothetical protein
MVTGDGHGHREFRCRLFGHRELALGFRRLKAERLTPERLTPVAVTRHLEWMKLGQHAVMTLPRYSYVVTRSRPYPDTRYSRLYTLILLCHYTASGLPGFRVSAG